MLGLLAVGILWLFLEAHWPGSVAFKITSGVMAVYVLSLRTVLVFGPKAKNPKKN
jgi:hypothetical protein